MIKLAIRAAFVDRYIPTVAAVILAWLWGCTGNGSQPSLAPSPGPTATPTPAGSVSISGTAIQGPMGGSTIGVFSVKSDGSNDAKLATITTDSKGNFTVKIVRTSQPIRLTVTGGSYTSEMDGATITSPSTISNCLPAVAENLTGISINPLTDFADSMAKGMTARGTPFDIALNSATAKVQSIYGLSTLPGMLIPDYTATGVGTDQGNFGLILGALANEDQYLCPDSPGGLVAALSADLWDETFDGLEDDEPIPYCGVNLSAIAGTSLFQEAVSGLLQLKLMTTAFIFGGTSNILSLNGLANLATGGSIIYPIAPLAKINSAIPHAAPSPVNTFAPAAETPSMGVARDNATATLLPNGKVLTAGGENSSGRLDSTELYDSFLNAFSPGPTMTAARAAATATLLFNRQVLIASGFGTSGVINTTELYNPLSNTFTAGPNMNEARYFASASPLPNGKVLISGGIGVTQVLGSTEFYDPVNDIFTLGPNMIVRRYAAQSTLLPNGKVLIAGGSNSSGFPTASTELYDPVTESYAMAPPEMNVPRAGATATLLPNGKVLIAGGVSLSGVVGSAELYDPATNSFTLIGNMNVARSGATATPLPSGRVLIAGGIDSKFNALNSSELYDPATNSFLPVTETKNFNIARFRATATFLFDGRVLIEDGSGPSGALRTAELYTP